MKQGIHVFCDRNFFLFRAPVLRYGMPYLRLKDCHVAALLAMTQKMVGFAIKPTIYISKMFEIRLAGAPCFGTGCHAFGLKIATAALRPRNDTNLERFCISLSL